MPDTQKHVITEQATLPLQTEAVRSAMAFCQYLHDFELSPLDVALAARVRYSSVWNIMHGIPVTQAHANQVRWGLQQITGVRYTAPILVIS